MRFRHHFQIVLFFLIVFIAYKHDWTEAKKTVIKEGQQIRKDAKYVNANTLTTEGWSKFRIAKGATTLRLLTNAALGNAASPATDLSNPRQGFRYAVGYEVIGRSGKVLAANEYHFRSDARSKKDASSGAEFNPIFFDDSNLVSAQTRPMQIAVDNLGERPVVLNVRLNSYDPGIEKVAARLLVRVERDDYQKRATWNRLSQARREDLCRYCVYDPGLLTESERMNLLRWDWLPAPTIDHFPDQRVYFVGQIDDQQVVDERMTGVVADKGLNATIPLPKGKAVVKLSFEPGKDLDPDSTVLVRWFGKGGQQQVVKRDVRDLGLPASLSIDGGLIEVESTGKVKVAVDWVPEKDQTETDREVSQITPETHLSKTYVVGQDGLDYRVAHASGQPTPVRVTLRYPFGSFFQNNTAQGATSLPKVTWELLNDAEEVIRSGQTQPSASVSKLSYLSITGGEKVQLTEPTKLYFRVPVDAARLRVRSDEGQFLVNVHTRPNGLQRAIKIRKEFEASENVGPNPRSWFGVNCLQEDRLLQENRVFLVHSYSRPPTFDDELISGRYTWQSYQPKGDWIARQILVPQDLEAKLLDRSLVVSYFLAEVDKPHSFTLPTTLAADSTPLRIIVVGKEPAGQIKVQVDGQTVLQNTVSSTRAQLTIDADVSSAGVLSIASQNPAKFFVGGRKLEGTARYLKRTAQRIVDGALEFEYNKQSQSEEVVTIQLYRDADATSISRVRVQIIPDQEAEESGVGPFSSWTIRDRIFELPPKPEPHSYILGSDKSMDSGQRCSVRLGAELPPGRYRIRLQQLGGTEEVYTLMYRATAGLETSKRKLVVTSNSE